MSNLFDFSDEHEAQIEALDSIVERQAVLINALNEEIVRLQANQITPEMRETYAALMASDMKTLTRLLPAFLEAFRVGMGGQK